MLRLDLTFQGIPFRPFRSFARRPASTRGPVLDRLQRSHDKGAAANRSESKQNVTTRSLLRPKVGDPPLRRQEAVVETGGENRGMAALVAIEPGIGSEWYAGGVKQAGIDGGRQRP